MIKIVTFKNKAAWNDIVHAFANHDVYYSHGYVEAFMLHGDGEPILIDYESDKMRGMYVAMKRDLSLLPWTEGKIRANKWFDLTSPYGYGGWIFEGEVNLQNMQAFYDEYKTYLLEHNCVSNFVRYSPVLKNAVSMGLVSQVQNLGKTIAIDLSSEDIIWENIKSKNRNMIRKARKNGVVIEHSKPTSELMRVFKLIYDETMRIDHAVDYYFFKDSFYQSIIDSLSDNTEVFYAMLDGKIIAISIILYCNGMMHYHLSGTVAEYRKYAPTNLLLYEAALWGCRQGFKLFHLGGGVGSGEDNLYKFKAAFNRNSDYQFAIGREVFNLGMYNQLVDWRKEKDPGFNNASSFFPVYRRSIDEQTICDDGGKPKTKKIAIYGAGGLGREVAGGIARINMDSDEKWEFIGFFDDNIPVGTQVSHYGCILGGRDALNSLEEPLALAIAVGDPNIRKSIFESINNPNITYPNLIAPSFKVLDSKTFKIGRGNIIQDSCSVTCDVTVGDFNVFNGLNVLGHDDVIGNFNVLMPSVHLSGNVHIGDCNLLGVNSVVLQKVKIGNHITLGAGSVLMTKPKDGNTYIGIPAKKFDFK